MNQSTRMFQFILPALLSLLWMLVTIPSAQAVSITQEVTLQPGWNAIYVELEPDENDIKKVFSGIPVASVWRWIPTGNDSPKFISDPADNLKNINGWYAWFPEPRPEAFLTNLFSINGNTAYLVKLNGISPVTLTITGKPRLRALRWKQNAFTLTGLHVNPTIKPTFSEFFTHSKAHKGQPVYKLSSNGQWSLINPASEAIESGQAYWVYTEGASNYQGRMRLVMDASDTLEFSAALTETQIVLRNASKLPGSFLIQRVGQGGLPLNYLVEDPESGEKGWPSLGTALKVNVPANDDAFVTLAVRRKDFSQDRMDQIFSITDELGNRILLYAGGNTIQPRTVTKAGASSKSSNISPFAGLWVGDISINAVSEAQQGGTQPKPVGQPFAQRFLIHVDASGKARLLKDVIQMWAEGQTKPSVSNPGFNEVSVPGRYVLLTDKSLIPSYKGAANKDGASVGLRYSTIAYDFEGQYLELGGGVGTGKELSANIVVGSDLPTNPFKHKYHPDHDNLDEQFTNRKVEAYQVVRNVRLVFTEEDPRGQETPGWGSTILGGQYKESMTGLHKNAIFASGIFRLSRVSAVPVLNK